MCNRLSALLLGLVIIAVVFGGLLAVIELLAEAEGNELVSNGNVTPTPLPPPNTWQNEPLPKETSSPSLSPGTDENGGFPSDKTDTPTSPSESDEKEILPDEESNTEIQQLPGLTQSSCPVCGGSGQLGEGACPICGGTGESGKTTCPTCGGTGRSVE
jgi:hypothetical protein